MTRDERISREENWVCWKCIAAAQPAPDAPMPNLDKSFEDISKNMKSTEKGNLRILQWNANGIKSKIVELEMRMKSQNIDVAMNQETKMEKNQKSPQIRGYVTIREDRIVDIRGGGLIIFIRESLVYEIVDRRAKTATESLTIRIRMARNKWVTATNVYCPPGCSSGQIIKLDLDSIPVSSSSIICGDINAHSPIWDLIQPEDDRGQDVVEWSSLKSLSILNDGSVTRINTATGNGSSPDLTFCGRVWQNKCTWSVDDEGIGSSDHSAIIININSSTKHQSIFASAPRWRNNGVSWVNFCQEVEKDMEYLEECDNLNHRVNRFNDILIKAANKHVRKVKPGKRTKSWLTPKCRNLIKTRNSLRKSISTQRKEWVQACRDTAEAIQEAKVEQWKEVVNAATNDMDERSTWKFIKSLNGTPDTNSPNEVLQHKGHKITSTKKKAELFAQHYAGVSRLQFTAQEKKENLRLKRLLDQNADSEEYPDFTMKELKCAIKHMKRKSAPGPDDIPPPFLKELGPLALAELLRICNLSLSTATCPQGWQNALIIPLLKNGKPPSAMASFRPVSLTSCVAKVLERMHAERLYYLAENNGWFSHIQAGFRRGRSCTDQILRICQAIEDGFQQKAKSQRSVLVLLDYSKAFDTVWRQKLLLSMADKGVPLRALKWIHGFLSNRQARVRLNGELSSSKRMAQGLPQGAVLSPLLFIFFINNLAECLPDPDTQQITPATLTYSLFADDNTLLASHSDKLVAMRAAQLLTDIVVNWSSKWKLTLNADKSEVGFFSTCVKEAKWEPVININNSQIPFAATPKLLGVYLDRQLTFNKHVEEVTAAATSKIKILAAVGNSTWGWRKDELKKLYLMFVKSKLDYAGPAWQPWLSDTNTLALERVQNKALRVITGQLKSTPVEALRAETRTACYSTYMKRSCLKSFELAKRLPEDHPRKTALSKAIPSKNKRRSWFRLGTALSDCLPPQAENRLPISFYQAVPWIISGPLEIHPELEGVSGREDSHLTIQAATERILNEWNADVTIYTDGSADAGRRDGGSAAVVVMNDDPPRTETIKRRGAFLTSSFEEEYQAMVSATEWIATNSSSSTRVLILTDSQSLCKALQGTSHDIDPLRLCFDACTAKIRIQWTPGHCGVSGNEAADRAANEARLLAEDRRPISYRGVLPTINDEIRDPPCRPEYGYLEQIYSRYSRKIEQEVPCRWDQVELARLRSGHHWSLRAYQNFVNAELSPRCPRCQYERETVEHWLECPGTLALRYELFGTVEVLLSVLTEQPLESLALSRRSLRGVGAPTAH